MSEKFNDGNERLFISSGAEFLQYLLGIMSERIWDNVRNAICSKHNIEDDGSAYKSEALKKLTNSLISIIKEQGLQPIPIDKIESLYLKITCVPKDILDFNRNDMLTLYNEMFRDQSFDLKFNDEVYNIALT